MCGLLLWWSRKKKKPGRCFFHFLGVKKYAPGWCEKYLVKIWRYLVKTPLPTPKNIGGRPSVWDLKLLLQSHSIPKIDSTKCNTSVNATRYLKKFCAYIYARHLEGEKEGGAPVILFSGSNGTLYGYSYIYVWVNRDSGKINQFHVKGRWFNETWRSKGGY